MSEFLLRDLPDQNGARLFLDRLANEQPRIYRSLTSQPAQRALLADVLALAAWSPLLATTLEQTQSTFHGSHASAPTRVFARSMGSKNLSPGLR